ncbi:MAG TPA: alpha/beta hydrolase [Chloroflexota bacterium]|jgi:pimeloyl-ACP methyl ester carboxylesterase|nr:alpha/beta hydrolase [Chloroflexota bacterium]
MYLEEKTARVADTDIQYRETGSGQPIVMLHGGGGFRLDERAFAGLAQRFRVLVPSMPGFDNSTQGHAKDPRDVADVMADFIRQVAGARAIVIGESFGGGVSSWLAARHPDVVERLILAAPAGLRAGDGPRLLDLSPQQVSVLLYGRPPDEQPGPTEAERRTRNRHNSARLGSTRPPFDADLFEQLKNISAPTLVIWGTADGMISPDSAQNFISQIPGARLVRIEGAPHVLSAAVPEEFLAAVFEFLGVRQTEATSRAAV